MKMLKFVQFVNEAQLKNRGIISQLDRIHEIKSRLKTLTAEVQEIEAELKEFDADIKPIFDAMRVLDDRIATTERYVVKITRYGDSAKSISYAKAVEDALGKVDEASQAIIKECVRLNTSISDVKHSFTIERIDEAKLTDKAKALIVKLSAKIKGMVNKFINFFDSKISKIDSANQKLAELAK
jgi:uncharacterized protein YabE (DUF348 family)